MSTSPARVAANRRNAQKSTGPRTEEGKKRVSQNALTHGLTAQHICLDEESSNTFYTLRRRMLEDLNPQGEIECQLAEQLIVCRWRLMRSWETETDLYNQSLETNPSEDSPVRRRTQAFTELASGTTLDKIGRYESRISREYDRCLRRLMELKAARRRQVDHERKHPASAPTPIRHDELLSADEYIRLQTKTPAPVQNKPNPAPGSAPSGPRRPPSDPNMTA